MMKYPHIYGTYGLDITKHQGGPTVRFRSIKNEKNWALQYIFHIRKSLLHSELGQRFVKRRYHLAIQSRIHT